MKVTIVVVCAITWFGSTQFVSSLTVNRNGDLISGGRVKPDNPSLAESRSISRSVVPDEEQYEPASPYLFTYDIADNDNNKQFRKETSDGNSIRGSYGYTDANGLYRVVEYVADAKHGFRAKVKSNEPGMDNVEFGGSEQVPGHRRHSNNNFKFDSLNLDEVSPADHESMSSHPSGSSIWPANVYMEVAQPPTQIWQQSSPTLGSRYHRLNSDSRVHSESSNHHQQIMSPDRSNLVRPTLISRRTLAADTNYDFQHQPHMYEESASSLVARSANESPVAVNESPISNRRDESIVSLPDQNKRVLKQLLHSSRRPVEAESQRITQTRPTAQQVAFTVNDQTASSIELITRKPTQHSVPVLKSTNQTPSSRIVPSDHNWPFTTSFGSKIDHKVIVSSNSTSNPISEKQSTTSNPIRFDNSEIRNQN